MHGLERFAALALALCLAGCKGSEETLPKAGPAEDPAAASAPATPAPPSATTPAAPATAVATPRSPGQPAASSSSAVSADAGAASDAGRAADAGSASSPGTKAEACFNKCKPVLDGCLTPTFSADGGLPKIKDPAACQAAFDACRKACAL